MAPLKRGEDPIGYDIFPSRLYWVRVIFPEDVNEQSPIDYRIPPSGEIPIFDVQHLDKRTGILEDRPTSSRQLLPSMFGGWEITGVEICFNNDWKYPTLYST
jgi:hypothetical protein